ncbi:MAG: hypothetical protein JXR48_02585 [Candidatus Delongbacteria bacterium]|nr:hypothetical protein [Candidatus Delongbacteria bacterium]MBN2833834.1 hypothetical protein [Candidatus Delongbacteria bacterium]
MRTIMMFTFVSFMLLTISCASMVKSAVKDSPISNKVFIHKNPKIGDMAVLESVVDKNNPQASFIGKTTSTMTVKDIKGDLVTVKHDITSSGMMSISGDMFFEYVVDLDGNVKSAVLIEGSERTPLKIAQPGDKGYNQFDEVSTEDMQKYNAQETITVPVGTFECTARYYVDPKKNGEVQIYYTSDEIPFCHIASYVVYENDGYKVQPIVELVNKIKN